MTKNRLIKSELYSIQKPVSKFLKQNEVSIVTGAAGTSKTHIALYTALEYLLEKKNGYDKILITKPIVEVGRSIGLLPGEIKDKVDPYRKTFDEIISTIIGNDAAVKRVKDKIEFVPVNFIRGNTFKDCIVVLSEGQNMSLNSLISFITRLDKSAKMFIDGDLYQSDIGKESGLRDLLNIVEKVDGIEHMRLGDEFQTRNPMIVRLNREYNNFRAKI